MKAVLCSRPAAAWSLTVAEVDEPRPGPNEVVIAVDACGVNYTDLLLVQERYQVKPTPPFVPGSEIAGVVVAVGAGVEELHVGDAVMAWMLRGGFAERVAVPASSVVPIGADVDRTAAATFLIAYGTAYHALVDRAAIRASETVLVLGAAGGVGLASVDVAVALGADVIAVASTTERLAVASKRGARAAIAYRHEDLRQRLRELTDGVDVVVDPVGGVLTEPALRSLRWNGRLLVVGFASGDVPRIALNLPLLKGSSVVGVYWGEFRVRELDRYRHGIDRLLELWSTGRLQPHVTEVYPLDEAAAALQAMETGTIVGKIALSTSPTHSSNLSPPAREAPR